MELWITWEDGEACYLLRSYIEGISLADYFERRLYLSDMVEERENASASENNGN